MKPTKFQTDVADIFENRLPDFMKGAYERRPGQLEMADRVAAAFETGTVAVIEAETGLGKSLAYLLPLLLRCKQNGGRAVVSTYTRNLQKQLYESDLPLALSAVGGEVNAAVLMGRTNYACRRGIDAALNRGVSDPAFAEWLRLLLGGEIGDLENQPGASAYLDLSTRLAISCPSKETACAGCRHREGCFLIAARRRALDSQVIFINHALLFSNLATDGALLGPYDVLVVDEAHHLEDVATQFMTLSYSPRSIRGAQGSAYSPEFEELIKYARAMIGYQSQSAGKSIDRSWAAYHDAMREADQRTAELFAIIDKNMSSIAPRSGGGDSEPVQLVYGEGAPVFYEKETLVPELTSSIARMAAAVEDILEVTNEQETSLENGVRGAIRAIGDAAGETLAELEFLTSGSADDHVFYMSSRGSVNQTKMSASPIDVGTRLGTMLEESANAAVLTSATMAVDGDFSYALKRIGLDHSERVSTRRFESPFDLENQRRIFLASYPPDPGTEGFMREASETIIEAVGISGKKTLVLCTARSQIPPLVRLLSAAAETKDNLFVQTDGGSRGDLLDRFKRRPGGILIGLASFWEGVDLPGELLELLIVLKLPFLVPTEPVVQARAKHLSEIGENPFNKLFLPDVVLKLRQGIGRLIRTSSDRGVVLILDRRLRHSRNGRFIMEAAAKGYVNCDSREYLIEQIENCL